MIRKLLRKFFKFNNGFKSSKYWESRYLGGNNSGRGSYGELAAYKAEIINNFLTENNINNAIEFGCGDGNQLSLIHFKNYLGFDVSKTIIKKCKIKFKGDSSKSFKLLKFYANEKAELSLSLDVIFHLIEDDVFNEYMQRLFNASEKYVIIYSSNHDEKMAIHVRHRNFTKWVEENRKDWQLEKHIVNIYPYDPINITGSPCDFFIYKKFNYA